MGLLGLAESKRWRRSACRWIVLIVLLLDVTSSRADESSAPDPEKLSQSSVDQRDRRLSLLARGFSILALEGVLDFGPRYFKADLEALAATLSGFEQELVFWVVRHAPSVSHGFATTWLAEMVISEFARAAAHDFGDDRLWVRVANDPRFQIILATTLSIGLHAFVEQSTLEWMPIEQARNHLPESGFDRGDFVSAVGGSLFNLATTLRRFRPARARTPRTPHRWRWPFRRR